MVQLLHSSTLFVLSIILKILEPLNTSEPMISLWKCLVPECTSTRKRVLLRPSMQGMITCRFDPSSWKSVRRIQTIIDEPMIAVWARKAKSRVRTDLKSCEILDDDTIMSRVVDYDWLAGYLVNLWPPLDFRQTGAMELGELKRAMGSRKLELKWPVKRRSEFQLREVCSTNVYGDCLMSHMYNTNYAPIFAKPTSILITA